MIGGGTAGMTSALALATRVITSIWWNADRLGGNALKLHTSWRRDGFGLVWMP